MFLSPEVEFSRAGTPAGPATLALRGEHDLASRDAVRDALAGVDRDVVVDLSRCAFIDFTVMGVLVAKVQDLERVGHRLELVAPPENAQVARAVSVARLSEYMRVHDYLPDGVGPDTEEAA